MEVLKVLVRAALVRAALVRAALVRAALVWAVLVRALQQVAVRASGRVLWPVLKALELVRSSQQH